MSATGENLHALKTSRGNLRQQFRRQFVRYELIGGKYSLHKRAVVVAIFRLVPLTFVAAAFTFTPDPGGKVGALVSQWRIFRFAFFSYQNGNKSLRPNAKSEKHTLW